MDFISEHGALYHRCFRSYVHYIINFYGQKDLFRQFPSSLFASPFSNPFRILVRSCVLSYCLELTVLAKYVCANIIIVPVVDEVTFSVFVSGGMSLLHWYQLRNNNYTLHLVYKTSAKRLKETMVILNLFC